MSTWLSRRRGEWFLISVCLLLCAAYFCFFVNRATVEVSIDVDKRTFLRIYWAQEGDTFSAAKNSRILVSPDKRDYQFYLTDIGRIDQLRLDPHDYKGTSTILKLALHQKGWQSISLSDPELIISPGDQVADFKLDGQGLVTTSSGKDPYFIWEPSFVRETFGWPMEISRLLALFLMFYVTGSMAGRLVNEKNYIPVYLAMAAALIMVMAVATKRYVHPDEYVHVQAAEYYTDHWLPPDVTDEDIRDTYSRYGNSRLNGNEIYYLFAGKFAALTEPLPIPEHLKFRLFNIFLFLSAVLVAIKYTTSRLVMAVLLVSPQLWYIFSYCNSDAFAMMVGVLAGWQVVNRGSVLNRFLQGGDESVRVVSLLLPAITVGLLFLIKKNYYPLGFFLGILVFYRIWLNRERIDARQAITRLLIVCLIGMCVPAAKKGLDYWVNGVDRNVKIVSMQEELAEPLFNPVTELDKRNVYLNMKERGVTLNKLITVHRWFEKSFRSAFGVYGHMTVQATHVYYDLVRWLTLALFSFVVGSVLIRGGWPERLVMIGAVCCGVALVAASLHHSWTADFQAQGRYLFPAALIIAVGAANAERFVSRRVLCLLLTLMFVISGYSFIGVALVNISRIA